MNLELAPKLIPMFDENGNLNSAWGKWINQVDMVRLSSIQSGTTANRPTVNLWPGRMYFDTSLGANGKPIWCNKTATAWVLADGTAA